MRLDVSLNKLRVKFKEKTFEQTKKKVMHKLPLDKFASDMSIIESELNDLKEKYKHQNGFENEAQLLLDKPHLCKEID